MRDCTTVCTEFVPPPTDEREREREAIAQPTSLTSLLLNIAVSLLASHEATPRHLSDRTWHCRRTVTRAHSAQRAPHRTFPTPPPGPHRGLLRIPAHHPLQASAGFFGPSSRGEFTMLGRRGSRRRRGARTLRVMTLSSLQWQSVRQQQPLIARDILSCAPGSWELACAYQESVLYFKLVRKPTRVRARVGPPGVCRGFCRPDEGALGDAGGGTVLRGRAGLGSSGVCMRWRHSVAGGLTLGRRTGARRC